MFLLEPEVFLWDFALLIVLCFFASLPVVCFSWKKRQQRKSVGCVVACSAGVIGVIMFCITLYAAFIEPQIIVVSRHHVAHGLAPSMKVVVVSDPHVGPYKGAKFMQRVVEKINAELPDIVLLPGDFIYTKSADISALDPLAGLRTTIGAYAILGNHDVGQYMTLSGKRFSGANRGERIADKLTELGITVLRNEADHFTLADGNVAIAGIDDMWTGHHNLPSALSSIEPNEFSILLSHNPSIIEDKRSLQTHLIVAGHTHGGQLRLPGIGSITTLPISIDQQYDQGVFEIDDDTILAITRGVGESSPRMRLFAWPEVMVIDLNSTID